MSIHKQISFLLGAGFSIPAGLPSTFDLNRKLGGVKASEIFIHTDLTAGFLNGREDINSFQNRKEKIFVEEFLDFYRESVIPEKEFHYEDFFDYYSSLRYSTTLPQREESFFSNFKEKNNLETNHQNILADFDNTFNQLLSRLLMKVWPQPICYEKEIISKYWKFLQMINSLRESLRLNLHSLNHDLLVEFLSGSMEFRGSFSDGFSEQGSAYFGNLTSRCKPILDYQVRLRRFTNTFTSRINLYKLHGSIDQYSVNNLLDQFEVIKIPYGVAPYTVFEERVSDEELISSQRQDFLIFPYFLSGSLEKIKMYDTKSYFLPQMEHFQNNLRNSEVLIVIGYGFKDSMINQFVANNFSSVERKLMILIDTQNPISNFKHNCKVEHFESGIENFDSTELRSLLKDYID